MTFAIFEYQKKYFLVETQRKSYTLLQHGFYSQDRSPVNAELWMKETSDNRPHIWNQT